MFKHEQDNIYLDGLKIPLSVFMRLEPSYQYPPNLIVMFYDGKRRHYRTQNNSWTINGAWEDGNRYLNRIDEFFVLLAQIEREKYEISAEVEKARNQTQNQSDIKAKYPEEVTPNVELQQRNDLNKSGTKRVRASGKRTPRS